MQNKTLNIIADEQIVDAERISGLGNIQFLPGREISNRDLLNADVLLVRSVTNVNQELLANTPLKFVGTATSGIDHIDTTYLEENNIKFVAAYGCNACSVVEYVLSALFALAEQDSFALQDKTVGIVGLGQVGSRLQKALATLNVNTLCNDPPLQAQGVEGLVSLDALCKEADIVSLHVPLQKEGEHFTWKLFDHNRLASLKQNIILINTARGGVVDESVLHAFKLTHPDSSLVFDVWENEPQINIDTVQITDIATPHIAGYSYDGKLKATQVLSQALSHWLSSEIKSDAVDTINALKNISLTSAEPVAEAIFSGYDVRIDHASLMPILREPPLSRANYFDMLRRTYPKRREFQTINITNQLDASTMQMLDALGFQTNTL